MKTQFRSSGYGMLPENFQSRFAPTIAFESDNGTGGSGGAGTPPTSTAPDNSNSGGDSGTDNYAELRKALDAEREQRKQFESKSKQFEGIFKQLDSNATPEEIAKQFRELKTLQAQSEQWGQKEQELRTSLETEHNKRVQAEQLKTQEFETKYNGLLLRTQAERAFQAVKGRTGAGEAGVTFFDTLMASIAPTLKLDDKGTLEVVDAQGKTRYSAKDASKKMTPTEYFELLTKDPVLGYCFDRQSNGQGGGMNPNQQNYQNPGDWKTLNRTQQMSMAFEAKE